MDRRRAVIGVIGLIAASRNSPVIAQQSEKTWRIGFLGNDPTIPSTAAGEAFAKGLREQGFVEGKNLVIERRFAEGRTDVLPELAAQLDKLALDLIVASSTGAVFAVKKLKRQIPIVMMNVADPVGTGIVANLAAPEGNVTGLVNDVSPAISAKRLQLLKDAVPSVARIGVVLNPEYVSDRRQLQGLEQAAARLSVTLQVFPVRRGSEYPEAFTKINQDRPDALLAVNNGINLTYRRVLVAFAAEHHLPAMYGLTEPTRDGGLMSYAANRAEIYHRAAWYVARLLHGAKPRELPVEQPTKYDFVINARTAKALGLTIPPSVLLRADEVIE